MADGGASVQVRLRPAPSFAALGQRQALGSGPGRETSDAVALTAAFVENREADRTGLAVSLARRDGSDRAVGGQGALAPAQGQLFPGG